MVSHAPPEMHRQQTAPSTPNGTKRVSGFFKKHLGPRRHSNVSFPNGQPPSPTANHHSPPSPTMRRASAVSQKSVEDVLSQHSKVQTNGSAETAATSTTPSVPSENGGPASPRQGSKPGGVKWAATYDDTTSSRTPTRTRRTSSAGTGGRRTSIYMRGADNRYVEGVDAGVGSKARRLSVLIPNQLEVDEQPLNDHFNLYSRHNKKDIGEGGAAMVRLMTSKTAGHPDKKVVAVKEFREWDRQEESEDDYTRKIKSEYAIAKSCDNENIVKTFRLCVSDHKWFHVMEYCELGDLNDLINKEFFSVDDRNCMFKQLMRGVGFLHARGIAHRDIKSENLLVDREGCLKIADFGTAEVFAGTHPGLKGCRRQSLVDENCEVRKCTPGLVGSRPYMAPEIIKHDEPYDPRGVDVWASAVVFLTLCVGGTPWDCASTEIKNYNIFCSTWDKWTESFPDGEVKAGRPLPGFANTKQFGMIPPPQRTMVMGMMHPDPAHRWSAKDVLETKIVQEFDCCQQRGYSDDISKRQRKVMHNHVPPDKKNKKGEFKG